MESKSLKHLVFPWFGGGQMDMAKNVTFAHVLLDSMLEISIKFNILTCIVIPPVPHGPDVLISLPPRVLERDEDSVSEESLFDNHLTEC